MSRLRTGASVARVALLVATGVAVGSPFINADASAGATRYVATAISVGNNTACAVVRGGRVLCWGGNASGQLGNGTTNSATAPVFVKGVTNAKMVATGGSTSCAVLAGGSVSCWGFGESGQLGNGKSSPAYVSKTPVKVEGISNAVTVSVLASSGNSIAVCAALSNGTLRCWGFNGNGALANPSSLQQSATPVSVAGLVGVKGISGGLFGTSCALAAGRVACWGSDVDGELGNGTVSAFPSFMPVTVSGIGNAKMVSAGTGFACAVLTTGSIDCWGSNAQGQLGTGSASPDKSVTPVVVKGIGNAVAVSARWGSACALLTTGTVKCWGDSEDGDLGNGTNNSSLTPVIVKGIRGAKAISSGEFSSCALLATGSVECWGDNEDGQLGRGGYVTPLAQATPAFVKSLGPALPLPRKR